MSGLIAFEPDFLGFFQNGAMLRQVWTGGVWTEGPSWLPMVQSVVFSDIPNDRQMIHCVAMDRTWELRGGQRHFVNGTTLDRAGRLLICEHGTRALSRLSLTGERQVLASHYHGGRLNSPNDVIEAPNGDIWFTDPSYGLEIEGQGIPGPKEQAANAVYRFSAQGALEAMFTDFAYPNGLAMSADGQTLIVADSGGRRSPGNERHLRRFRQSDNLWHGGTVLATCPNGVFDGFRIDRQGFIWASAADGVYVISPDGTFIGCITVPECVSNLCFGGPQMDWLFITATTSLYTIQLAQPRCQGQSG